MAGAVGRLHERVFQAAVAALALPLLVHAGARLPAHGRQAGVGGQVRRVLEAEDVADLGGDDGPADAPHARDGPQDADLGDGRGELPDLRAEGLLLGVEVDDALGEPFDLPPPTGPPC